MPRPRGCAFATMRHLRLTHSIILMGLSKGWYSKGTLGYQNAPWYSVAPVSPSSARSSPVHEARDMVRCFHSRGCSHQRLAVSAPMRLNRARMGTCPPSFADLASALSSIDNQNVRPYERTLATREGRGIAKRRCRVVAL